MVKAVIKAQRAFNVSNRVLIYNQDRTIFQELDNAEVLLTAIGDRSKCYLEVTINDDGIMSLEREVKANW